MFKVTIDNQQVDVEEGTTILQAARMIGGKVVPPAMCYYSKLRGSGGKCRTCLVKVAQSSAKDPRPMPKLVASCSTPVQDGMVVQNLTSPEVVEARKAIVEFLLLNHPLDCPVCDQAGECDLQDLSFRYGMEETESEEDRREFPVTDIGDKAFLGCTSLTGITIGNNITNLGWDTFYNCTSLTNVTFGGKIASIEGYLFRALQCGLHG